MKRGRVMSFKFEDYFKALSENAKKYSRVIVIITCLTIISSILSLGQVFISSPVGVLIFGLLGIVLLFLVPLVSVYLQVSESIKIILGAENIDKDKVKKTILMTLLWYLVLMVSVVAMTVFLCYFFVWPVVGVVIFIIYLILLIIGIYALLPAIYYSIMRYYLGSSKNIFALIFSNIKLVWKTTYGVSGAYYISILAVGAIIAYPTAIMTEALGSGNIAAILVYLFVLFIATYIGLILRMNFINLMMNKAYQDYNDERKENQL